MSNQDPKKDGPLSRRSILKKGGIAAGLITIASFFNPLPPVQAATTKVDLKTLKGTAANKYLQVVLATHQYQQFKTDVSHKYASRLSIQDNQSTVFKVNNSTIIVRIPVTGKIEGGFYSVVFKGTSLTIDTTFTALLLPITEESIHAIVTKDGQSVLNTTITPEQVQPYAINWGCLNQCLSNAGIPWASVAILSALCSLLCAVAPGVCISCLISSLGSAGAVVAICVGTCWR